MKRYLFMLIAIILSGILISACTTPQEPVNGFSLKGEDFRTGFAISSQDLLNILNNKLKDTDYPQLEMKSTSDEEFISFIDGEKNYSTDDLIEVISYDEGTISGISCNIEIMDEYTSEKSGFYYQMLIEIFSPRHSKEVIQNLYIFDGIPEAYAQSLYVDGDVKYSFTGGSLRIRPSKELTKTMLPKKAGT